MIDANVFVSALLKDSETRKILLLWKKPLLLAPEFIKQELLKYVPEFAERLNVKEDKLKELASELFESAKIEIIPQKEYLEQIKMAHLVSPDPNDAHYFAIALKFCCPIWSQDKDLKKQTAIKVYSTKELIEEMLRDAK